MQQQQQKNTTITNNINNKYYSLSPYYILGNILHILRIFLLISFSLKLYEINIFILIFQIVNSFLEDK